jgi:putative ABC transport system ATP-binding protein
LTAEENIYLPLELNNRLTTERREYINGLLELVGLLDRRKHRPDELSGGEQQRIGVAAALANNPEIILCDEPTGELDSISKQVVMDLLRKVIDSYPNKTMIIVTHDADLRNIADRMYYIRDGKISHTFSPDELKAMRENKSTGEEGGETGNATQILTQAREQTLIELREIEEILRRKIEKIDKENHAI